MGVAQLRFELIDKIESLTDERIIAVKQVSLAEEYLADHFPTFAVLPGVLMLEALTQAASWLLHRRRSFARSMAVLKDARHVKYGRFVAPGDWLRVEVDFMKDAPDGAGALFRGTGTVGTAQAVSARLELAYFDLGQRRPELAVYDPKIQAHTRARLAALEHATVRV